MATSKGFWPNLPVPFKPSLLQYSGFIRLNQPVKIVCLIQNGSKGKKDQKSKKKQMKSLRMNRIKSFPQAIINITGHHCFWRGAISCHIARQAMQVNTQ